MLRIIATALQKSDYRRWSDDHSFDPSWEPRTERAAALVPIRSRVIEFGAGNRRLEQYLDPSCTYTPSDMVDRGPGTIVCDLNRRPLPDLGTDVYDVAVILGVLEYLSDVPSVLDWLANYVPFCVLSYVCAETNRYSLRGIRDSANRVRAGWMSNYRDAEIRSLFRERGYALLQEESWENNRVFVFSQHSPSTGGTPTPS